MTHTSINVACGFLGGTILSVAGGYRVLEHPSPERIFARIAEARWFLAVRWCDRWPTPAGILNHEGQLAFLNWAALSLGESLFLPLAQRGAVFEAGLVAAAGEPTIYTIGYPGDRLDVRVEVRGLALDPRYGKVAAVRTL